MSEKTDDVNNKSIVFEEEFNLFSWAKLKVQVGDPVLKKNSLATLIQIKEKRDLCDTQTRSVIHSDKNTLLVIFKEHLAIFQYHMVYKNMHKIRCHKNLGLPRIKTLF